MKIQRDVVIGSLFGLLSAFGYGLTTILIRKGVADMATPFTGASIALLSGAIVLSLNIARKRDTGLRQNKSGIGWLLIAGVLAAGGIAARYNALSIAPAVLVSPVIHTSPLIAVLGTYLFLGKFEKITRRIVLGAVLVVVGAICISIGGLS